MRKYFVVLLVTLTACGDGPLIPICGETGANCRTSGYVPYHERQARIVQHDAMQKYVNTK